MMRLFNAACAIASMIPGPTSLSLAFSVSGSYRRRWHLAQRRGGGGSAIASTSASSGSASTSKGDREARPYDETYVVEFEPSDVLDGRRFDAQAFASSNCWGRRPFLMREAFDPDLLLDAGRENGDCDGEEPIRAWPSWGEVVAMASDDESESRIISHVPGDHASFDVRWGPLSEKDVDSWLSKGSDASDDEDERRETLVVNDVDRFYPPLADWMRDAFRFVPNWRLDDGQVSLAEIGGGIGPHVDNYDVFLIQTSGTRTWQVGRRKMTAAEERDGTMEGLDVRVLDGWDADRGGGREMEEWTVNPGDLLYLPPRVAHCGTARSGDCATLSVGCRAPSVSDLVSKLAESLSSSMEDSALRRYTDDDLLKGVDIVDNAPGELTSDAKERAKHLVIDSMTTLISDDEWWDEFFGRYVTEQKRARNNYPIPLEDWVDDCGGSGENQPDEWEDAQSIVQSVLAGGSVLYQAEGITFAYSSVPSKIHKGRCSHRFYVDGEMWHSESQSPGAKQNDMAHIFQLVSNHRRIDRGILLDRNDIGKHESTQQLAPEAVQFLEELVSAGVLYGSDE